MARPDEITSTEKLLEVIRGKNADPLSANKGTADPHPLTDPLRKESLRKIPGGAFSAGKPVTVGIEIGQKSLRMVKAAKSTGAVPEVFDQKIVSIPLTSGRNSSGFTNFLRTELNEFCRVHKNIEIWALMPATDVEIRHVRIPRVAKKQMETAVYWAVKKEAAFNEAEAILDYKILDEVVDKGINKLEVMYYTVTRWKVEEQKKLFALAGWPLTGLSIVPFAIQNILRAQGNPDDRGTVASLFIGNDFSRIDIFSSANLVMTRDIKAGMGSMGDAFIDGMNERNIRAGDGPMESEEEKNHARSVLFSLNSDAQGPPEEIRYGLTGQEIWEMVLPALERLIRQVERTLEYFAINMGNEKVGKVYISGVMNFLQPIADYAGEQLGISSDVFDPLKFMADDAAGSATAASPPNRTDLVPAFGIALSDNAQTPNFLFTHKDRQGFDRIKRINRAIFATFFGCAFFCIGYFLYQTNALREQEQRLQALNAQLSRQVLPVNRDLIAQTVTAWNAKGSANLPYYEQYEGMAIIAEISHLASPGIRLVTLKVSLGAAAGKSKDIEMEGFVIGDKKSPEGSLAAYLIRLDGSPLFHQVKIQKTNEEAYKGGAMLRFTATMKVEGA